MTEAEQRFWKYVDKTGDCWNWLGGSYGAGYGGFYIGGGRENRKRAYAHRFAYEHHVGPIPEGLEIDHLCRNRRCVNPDHLEKAVTHQVNQLRAGPHRPRKYRRKVNQ